MERIHQLALFLPKTLINPVNHNAFHLLVQPYFLNNINAYPELSTVKLSKLKWIIIAKNESHHENLLLWETSQNKFLSAILQSTIIRIFKIWKVKKLYLLKDGFSVR